MKIRITSSIIAFTTIFNYATAQIDSTLLKRVPTDTVKKVMNMDAIYNRPFLRTGKVPVSLGGYMETNWQHIGTDGVSSANFGAGQSGTRSICRYFWLLE